MFRFNKIEEQKEQITIEKFKNEIHNVKTKETSYYDSLSFDVDSEFDSHKISVSFELNCPLQDLLKIESYKTIEFDSYIEGSELFFTIDGKMGFITNYHSKITRWIKNKYIIEICFISELNSDTNPSYFAGELEIDLDLDNYL